MSASRERKKRMAQEQQPVPEVKQPKKKLASGWVFAICMVLVLVLVFGSIAIYRSYWANQTVLTVGSHAVSPTEFNYFYNSQANTISSYASYMGIDTSVGLDKQKVSSSGTLYMSLFGMDTTALADLTADEDGNYDITWAQLLADNAMRAAASYYSVYDEAQAAGYTLDADALAEIDETIANLEAQAVSYGVTTEELLESAFGHGSTLEGYRSYLELSQTYYNYPTYVRDNYSAEEVSARYDESPEDFDVVSFYSYSTTASDYVTTDDDGNKSDVTDENRTAAREAAEAMLAEFDSSSDDVSITADHTREDLTSEMTEECANWLFDEAKVGDVKMFTKEATTDDGEDTYYVVKLLANTDYPMANLQRIYIQGHTHSDDETEEDHEAEAAELEAKLEAVRAALEEDASRDNFLALAEEYATEDTDVEVTNQSRANMTSSKEMSAWLFDEEREPGDYAEFEVSGNVIFVYYDGLSESRSDYSVKNTLATEWLEKIAEDSVAACNYNESAAMHANVGVFG